jgi:hypothetical protein
MKACTRLPHMATTHHLPAQAERMGSMPLHNLTPVRLSICQSRQAPSYLSADKMGYGSAHTPAKYGNHPLPACTGRADGIYAAAQSHACEIVYLPE